MIDNDIADKINTIKDSVDLINTLIAELHENKVEVRIKYEESAVDNPPRLNFWRATEHVDYLKSN